MSAAPEALLAPAPHAGPPRRGKPQETQEAAEVSPPASARLRHGLELVGLIVAPTTLLTALAFYFGWTLTSARSLYFGIDPSALGYSTQDYLLRSADALFVPLGALIVFALAAVALRSRVERALQEQAGIPRLRQITIAASALGAALLVYGIAAVFWALPAAGHHLAGPLSPGLGALILAYSVGVRRRLDRRVEGQVPPRSGLPPATVVLVGLLVVLSLFWTASEYAQALGRGRGAALEGALAARPQVTVTTARPLGLAGATETEVARAGGEPVYRYEGLRVLVRSGGHWFLVPDGWTRRDGVAVMLAEGDVELIEFRSGR